MVAMAHAVSGIAMSDRTRVGLRLYRWDNSRVFRQVYFFVLSSIFSPVHSQRLLPRSFYWALGINNVSKKYSVEALKQKGYAVSCFLNNAN